MSEGAPEGRDGILATAAVLGLTGVGLGAFGAHALEGLLEASGRVETWETAVLYQLVHAVALLALAGLRPLRHAAGARWVARLWAGGSLVFSGSLYLLCLSGQTWLGAVTPLGGLALLLGWGLVLRSALASS